MITALSKFASAGVFFVLIFLSGYWLNRAKKPYSMLMVTIHKLIGLAAGVFLGLAVYRIHQGTALSTVQLLSVIVTVLFFAINVGTGSLLSTNKPMPRTVLLINKWFPYVTVIATGVMIYLLS